MDYTKMDYLLKYNFDQLLLKEPLFIYIWLVHGLGWGQFFCPPLSHVQLLQPTLPYSSFKCEF